MKTLNVSQMYAIPVAAVLTVGVGAMVAVQPTQLPAVIEAAAKNNDRGHLVRLIDFKSVETSLRSSLREQYQIHGQQNEIAFGLNRGDTRDLTDMAASYTAAQVSRPDVVMRLYTDQPIMIGTIDFQDAFMNDSFKYSSRYVDFNTYVYRARGENIQYNITAKRHGFGWRIETVDIVPVDAPIEATNVSLQTAAPQQYHEPVVLRSPGPQVPESWGPPYERILTGDDELTFASPDGQVICMLNAGGAVCTGKQMPGSAVSCRPESCDDFGIEPEAFGSAIVMRVTHRISFQDGYTCVIMSESSIDCRGFNRGVTMTPSSRKIY